MLFRSEQMGIEKIATERASDFFYGASWRVVLGDVLRGMPIDEAVVRASFQLNRAHHEFLQGPVLTAWFAEREFVQAAFSECRIEQGDKFYELRSGHGQVRKKSD